MENVTENVKELVTTASLGVVGAVGALLKRERSDFKDTNDKIRKLPTGLLILFFVVMITLIAIPFICALFATYHLVPSHKAIHTVLVFLTGAFWVLVLWLWYGFIKKGRIQV